MRRVDRCAIGVVRSKPPGIGLDPRGAKAIWRFDRHASVTDSVNGLVLPYTGVAGAIIDSPIGPTARVAGNGSWFLQNANLIASGVARSLVMMIRLEVVSATNHIGGGYLDGSINSDVFVLIGGAPNSLNATGGSSGGKVALASPYAGGRWDVLGISHKTDTNVRCFLNGAFVGAFSVSSVLNRWTHISAASAFNGNSKITGAVATMGVWERALTDDEQTTQAKRCGVV